MGPPDNNYTESFLTKNPLRFYFVNQFYNPVFDTTIDAEAHSKPPLDFCASGNQ